MLLAVIMGCEQPLRFVLSRRRSMRRLLWASFPCILGVTRNPSGRLVLEKADTSFNTGNAGGFRVSPNFHPTKAGDFAWLRSSTPVGAVTAGVLICWSAMFTWKVVWSLSPKASETIAVTVY